MLGIKRERSAIVTIELADFVLSVCRVFSTSVADTDTLQSASSDIEASLYICFQLFIVISFPVCFLNCSNSGVSLAYPLLRSLP